jgi:uncharacterized protein (DUF924 family)
MTPLGSVALPDPELEAEIESESALEHSEELEDQVDCVRLIQALCAETGDGELLRFAEMHRDIIQKFGRFPHRNAALGRESTPAEMAFLNEGGFAG